MNPDPKLGREMKAYIQTELLKASQLPPDELQAFLEPFVNPLLQIFTTIQRIQTGVAAWIEEHWEQIAAFRNFLQKTAVQVGEILVAADAASQRFLETLRRLQELAEDGWTFPVSLSMQDLNRFAQAETPAAAAQFMIDHLEKTDPEFKSVETRLLGDPLLQDFSTVLPQCFRAVRHGDYAIAIPSLMGMLERSIQSLNPPHLQADSDVVKTLRSGGTIAKIAQQDLFCSTVFTTLAVVARQLWAQHTLSMPSTPKLSRPAIQHGRIEPPNSKLDVLRLLNTLETSLALNDYLSVREVEWKIQLSSKPRNQAFQAMFAAVLYLSRRDRGGDREAI